MKMETFKLNISLNLEYTSILIIRKGCDPANISKVSPVP